MMRILLILIVLASMNPLLAQSSTLLKATVMPIAHGKGGIRFDYFAFSPQLHKILIPAGQTGKLYLIDPTSFEMNSIGGFTSSPEWQKGQEIGITAADEGEGFIFVADHGSQQLDVVDVRTKKIVAKAPLALDVDILRYVKINHEVWATEPDDKDKQQIEVFSFTAGEHPRLTHVLFIAMPGGPESLSIDNTHQRAFTNVGKNATAIDLKTHAITDTWPNTCTKSRGTAVDEARNFLFVACGEGKAVVLDLNQKGKPVASLMTGQGADLVDFNSNLSHFYITASKNAILSVLGVSSTGGLSLLGIGQAAMKSHCVIGDDQNNIWVCAPQEGQLLRYRDDFPKSN